MILVNALSITFNIKKKTKNLKNSFANAAAGNTLGE